MSRTAQRDSISRAFIHHELTGVVEFHSPPETGRYGWRVRFAGSFDVHELSDKTALIVCAALAAAEHVHAGAQP